MKKRWLLLVSILVLLILGIAGSFLYFSNFSKRIPVSQKVGLPRGCSR